MTLTSPFHTGRATTVIYPLSLHDALPIFDDRRRHQEMDRQLHTGDGKEAQRHRYHHVALRIDRKSTRLNSSHQIISYAVFCLKKKMNVTSDRPFLRDAHCEVCV